MGEVVNPSEALNTAATVKEANEIVDMRKVEKCRWNSKLFKTSVQIILPLVVGTLMGLYWIIGLRHYFA